MRVFVWLFHAAVEDAPGIRSILTTKARDFAEWPHLVVPGVDGPDMNDQLGSLANAQRLRGPDAVESLV